MIRMVQSNLNQKSRFKTLHEEKVQLPSGFPVTVSKKESPTGEVGISVVSGRFFLPVRREDVDKLAQKMIEIAKKV